LERFRYLIVASQLLNTHSYLGQAVHGQSRDARYPSSDALQLGPFTFGGAALTASFAFALAWLVHWTRGGGSSTAGKGRIAIFLAVVILLAIVSYAYARRQWLQYLRQQSLAEISEFIDRAQEFVSRGYRM